MVEQVPVYIPTRDRLTPLLELLSWLESVGQHEVYLVDNMSTYPPLLEYFERTPYRVFRLAHNLGHRAPFLSGVVQRSSHDRFFIVSDPDVVPDEGCPPDALLRFRALFDEFPEVHKVGFGLRIDDLPDHFALRDDVVRWEEQFWTDVAKPGVFRAAIDTTFAMYRPLEGRRHNSACSLRTGAPYVARHLPWYVDSSDLDEEESYYRKHADPTVTNWNRDQLPRWKQRRLVPRPSTPVEPEDRQREP